MPLGLSLALQDVEFLPGGVRTRPGLLAVFPALANGVQVNGLKSDEHNVFGDGTVVTFRRIPDELSPTQKQSRAWIPTAASYMPE